MHRFVVYSRNFSLLGWLGFGGKSIPSSPVSVKKVANDVTMGEFNESDYNDYFDKDFKRIASDRLDALKSKPDNKLVKNQYGTTEIKVPISIWGEDLVLPVHYQSFDNGLEPGITEKQKKVFNAFMRNKRNIFKQAKPLVEDYIAEQIAMSAPYKKDRLLTQIHKDFLKYTVPYQIIVPEDEFIDRGYGVGVYLQSANNADGTGIKISPDGKSVKQVGPSDIIL